MDSQHARGLSRRGFLALGAGLAVGCHGTGLTGLARKPAEGKGTGMPAAPTSRLAATWNPKIVEIPNTQAGGAPVPGLIGRVYLFDINGLTPKLMEGQLVVDLYDHTRRQEPVMLEQWGIGPGEMAQLAKPDTFGDGYSIPLPWSTYKSTIPSIYLAARFHPTGGGTPLSHQSGTIQLDHTEWIESLRAKRG